MTPELYEIPFTPENEIQSLVNYWNKQKPLFYKATA